MVKKIILSTLLLFLILGTTSFALTPSNEMTEETMQEILDYFNENINFYLATVTTNNYPGFVENVNIHDFTYDFNNFINTTEFPYLENLIFALGRTYQGVAYLTIYPNNNTLDTTLPFIKIQETKNTSGTLGHIGYYYNLSLINSEHTSVDYNVIKIQITSNGSYSFSTESFNTWNYKLNGNLETQITHDENSANIVETPMLLGLGINSSYYISDTTISDYQWYLSTTKINLSSGIVPTPSGDVGEDTESGDSGNGTGEDTGTGTTTPDYSQDLDNIQTGITNIENTIASGNQEIVGEIGEIKDFFKRRCYSYR